MKNKIEWDLNCSYINENVDSAFDEELNKLIGHRAHSSGFMIGDNERDLAWSFPTKNKAMEALVKIQNHNRIRMAEIFKYEE